MSGRRRHVPSILLCAMLACVGMPQGARGQAPDQPALLPSRDVTVTYRIDGVGLGGAHKVQIAYTQGGARTRMDYYRWVEATVPFMALVYDRPANRAIAIMHERRSFVERRAADSRNPGAFLRPEMGFTRLGSATVADTPCTEWKLRLPGKPEDNGTACVTADGIVLRLLPAKAGQASMTAIAIADGAATTTAFAAPDGYTRETRR
ncbi:MAG: hypothetical protein WDN25_26390 [Acetobacteraceae bacterium]